METPTQTTGPTWSLGTLLQIGKKYSINFDGPVTFDAKRQVLIFPTSQGQTVAISCTTGQVLQPAGMSGSGKQQPTDNFQPVNESTTSPNTRARSGT